jgi:hypothetical protein
VAIGQAAASGGHAPLRTLSDCRDAGTIDAQGELPPRLAGLTFSRRKFRPTMAMIVAPVCVLENSGYRAIQAGHVLPGGET